MNQLRWMLLFASSFNWFSWKMRELLSFLSSKLHSRNSTTSSRLSGFELSCWTVEQQTVSGKISKKTLTRIRPTLLKPNGTLYWPTIKWLDRVLISLVLLRFSSLIANGHQEEWPKHMVALIVWDKNGLQQYTFSIRPIQLT